MVKLKHSVESTKSQVLAQQLNIIIHIQERTLNIINLIYFYCMLYDLLCLCICFAIYDFELKLKEKH